MKKITSLSFALATGAILLLSSCSNQMYSYREKVKVDTKTAQAKPQTDVKEIASKTTTLPSSVMTQPAAPANAQANVEKTATAQSIAKDFKSVVPAFSSKAVAGAKMGIKSVKEQVKAVNSKIKAAEAKPGFQVDGIRWMIIGAILILAGWILGAIIGGSVFGIVGAIGGLIFIIGLIFWLIDVLK